MSSSTKRILNDLTNEKKRLKNDSGIDLNFDIGGLKQEKSQSSYSISTSSESSTQYDSMFDDDDVFEEEQSIVVSSSKIRPHQGRSRLNGTSTYQTKENNNKRKIKCMKKETIMINETLNQLREEHARIEAHRLALTTK